MPPKRKDPENGEGKAKKQKTGAANGGTVINSEPEDEIDPTFRLEGSMLTGEVLFCGGTNWDLTGRSRLPKGVKNKGGRNVWAPHRLESMKGVKVRSVISNCMACHSVLITEEGKAYTWGRNDCSQLGHGNQDRKEEPTLVESLKDLTIVDAACGKSHTLFLSDRGQVYSVGENKYGQLGLGHQSNMVPSPTRLSYNGPPIRKMAAGADFSMLVDIKGNLYSFGCPEYGQLGHNTDGKYFVKSNKLEYNCETRPRKVQVFIEKGRDGVAPVNDVEIVDVSCGNSHTVVLDRKKRIFTWGFGGYGRLGHAEPKDEFVPRLVKYFDGPNRGVNGIAAGSQFTLCINEHGALYLWGQTKTTGEANMYPKVVQDLMGWSVRSIGCCNRSIVVAADNSLVSWGPSPTYGELGYGENKPKTSSYPQEVKSVNGVYIQRVTCGHGHCLLLARADTEEDREKIDKLPVFVPDAK